MTMHMAIRADELRDKDLLHVASSTNYVLVAKAELDAHGTIAVTIYDGDDVAHDRPSLHFYPWELVELSLASPGRDFEATERLRTDVAEATSETDLISALARRAGMPSPFANGDDCGA
jgi:hypothetical protein